ncbi:hypothetical protein C8Q80DRAFT_1115116 [Daedaleopsis nitida]|nr:hypothetical protein C8Q80DRAFT_1115116 [Daedaleopsis nitida]
MSMTEVHESWPGLAKIKNLVVFGASYCDVGYNSKSPYPTAEQPLGVEFPGNAWCEPGKPNWVGHLILQVKAQHGQQLLAYVYALGGDTVQGVKRQVHQQFIPHLSSRPHWAPWTSVDTIFMTFVGINDCAINTRTRDPVETTETSIRELFAVQDELYNAGARHFCFIDVPPTHRFPNPGPQSRNIELTLLTWNAKLREAARTFATTHPDTTVVIWSAWYLFSQVLSDPASFGFKDDPIQDEGEIFVDGFHPTSAVHEIMAAQLLNLLSDLEPAMQVGTPSDTS